MADQSQAGLPADAILIPNLCEKHAGNVVWKLKFKRTDPWISGILVAQILLFQQWTKGQPCNSKEEMNELLRLIPCLGCHDSVAFHRVMLVLGKGLDHSIAVSKMEVKDPDLEGM